MRTALQKARDSLLRAGPIGNEEKVDPYHLYIATCQLLNHLEAQNPPAETPLNTRDPFSQNPQPQSEPEITGVVNLTVPFQAVPPQSEQPSSPGIGMAAGIRLISPTSREWSYRVNQDGTLTLSLPEVIADWLNSRTIPGIVPEVEIGVILTSKGSTPPAGSPSPSTEAPTPEASGHAGEYERCYSPAAKSGDDARDGCADFVCYHGGCVFKPTPASASPAEDASREGREEIEDLQRKLHDLPHYNGPGAVRLGSVLELIAELQEARDER